MSKRYVVRVTRYVLRGRSYVGGLPCRSRPRAAAVSAVAQGGCVVRGTRYELRGAGQKVAHLDYLRISNTVLVLTSTRIVTVSPDLKSLAAFLSIKYVLNGSTVTVA